MSNIEKRALEKAPQVEAAGTYMEDMDAPAPSMSLRDFIAILRRRKATALYAFVAVVVLGVTMTMLTQPQFRSNARILVEGKSTQVTISSGNDPLSNLFLPKTGQDVDTQVEILRSPLFLNKAFKQANLPPGSAGVLVQRVGETDILELTALSTSAETASKLIEVLPTLYQEETRLERQKDVYAALEFAQNSLKAQNNKLRRTEAALEQFKNRQGVVNSDAQVSAAIESHSATRQAVIDTEAKIAGLQAQLAALSAERNRLSPFSESKTTVSNPAVVELQNQLGDIKSERARKLFLYKPTHDEIRKLDVQIADLEKRIAATPGTITNFSRSSNPVVAQYDERIATLKADLESARAALVDARTRAEDLDSKISIYNAIAKGEAGLQRELQGTTAAVAALSETVTQLSLRHKALDAAGSPVTIIQPGRGAIQVAPRVSRNIILTLALGLLLGGCAALLQESLDNHVRGEDEARRLVRAPVLGHFPELNARSQDTLQDLTIPNPKILEGFRVLRTNVQFALVGTPGRTLQVLSSMPSEGKSFTSRNLAVAMALDGRSVILVDADLHRPSVHRAFSLSQQPGLTHVLVGRNSIEDVLQETNFPGLRIMAAGDIPPNPAELLNSAAMDGVIEHLQTLADIVIFDSPPMLATADGQVIASKVDGVIYVVELGAVPRNGLQRSFELLQQVNARIVGMVFNKVDVGQFTDAYYGDYYRSLGDHQDGDSIGGKGSDTDLFNAARPVDNRIGAPVPLNGDATTSTVVAKSHNSNGSSG